MFNEKFEDIGFDVSSMKEKSRKLIFEDKNNHIRFMLVKASDVPTYVEYGAADFGIVGRDTILEESRNLYEMIKFDFGQCKMAVAGLKGKEKEYENCLDLRVASKYTKIAKDYFNIEKNRTVEIIKLNGSVELAPLVGLSEVIVDIVESGKTLKENGLVVYEEICDISARLVVNKVSMKMNQERIMDIVNKIKKHIKEN